MNETPPATNGDSLYLIDGSGFIHRAFHAIGPLTRPDGTPVNAVFGFTNMLIRLLAEFGTHKIAVIFDAGRKNWRNDIYPDYKANRAETPEELRPQFPLVREAAEVFGLPAIEREGYEADDLIAAYTKAARAAGMNVRIVSSDKDLMQLVGEGIIMIDPIKFNQLGIDAVRDKFGVTPDKVVDVQALAGDPTDNVPGVPGIGVKTAAMLIKEYGSLDALLERAKEIGQPKRRQNLIDHAKQARISKRLVVLDADAPLPIPIDDIEAHVNDGKKRADFLKEQGFTSILARLKSQGLLDEGTTATSAATPSAIKTDYTIINDFTILDAWIKKAREAGIVAIDTETDSLTPATAKLVGLSLCIEAGRAAYVPFHHGNAPGGELALEPSAPDQLNETAALERLAPLLADPSVLKIGHNIKFDLQLFMARKMTVKPVDDTMLLSYCLDSSARGHGMDALAHDMLGIETTPFSAVAGTGRNQITFDRVPLDVAADYAAEDADVTRRLHDLFKPRLAAERMSVLYEQIERPLIPVIAKMELCGIKLDTAHLKRISSDFAARLADLEKDIHTLAGHSFNIASPKQLGEVLFDELGLPGGKKVKSGGWSTHADLLEPLAGDHRIVNKVLTWRGLAKLKGTYADALPEKTGPDGRVHTAFSMAATNTGRLASSDPNLQNIPIRTEEGRSIRSAFVAKDGHMLLSVDYSQVELRLAAGLAKVSALQNAFREGVDIHALTAAQMFDVPLDQVSAELRQRAKAINFGIIYGISAFGLARQVGCSQGQAKDFITRYLERFPELDAFMEARREEARTNGFVRTLMGRKCLTPGIRDKNPNKRHFAERQAINAPLQGTAADIMKLAMIDLDRKIDAENIPAKLLLQVHDELLLEVPDSEVESVAAMVKKTMENAADLSIPLVAAAGWGRNWSDAH